MEFDLSVPADFTEYLASSENVAQQLAKFGIKINVKPYPSARTQRQAQSWQLRDVHGYRHALHLLPSVRVL